MNSYNSNTTLLYHNVSAPDQGLCQAYSVLNKHSLSALLYTGTFLFAGCCNLNWGALRFSGLHTAKHATNYTKQNGHPNDTESTWMACCATSMRANFTSYICINLRFIPEGTKVPIHQCLSVDQWPRWQPCAFKVDQWLWQPGHSQWSVIIDRWPTCTDTMLLEWPFFSV